MQEASGLAKEEIVRARIDRAVSLGMSTHEANAMKATMEKVIFPIAEERLIQILDAQGLKLAGSFMQALGFFGYLARRKYS